MMKFEYVVWFKDNDMLPDDQDHEWPACFMIEAENKHKAHSWGDVLSRHYVAENAQIQFLNSDVKPSEDPRDLPVIRFGVWATDEFIGW